jgi:hypothetical protein
MGYKITAAAIASVGILVALWERRCRLKLQAVKADRNKLFEYYQFLNHWLEIKNEGKTIASYFEDMGYSHIAVYGMAELGNRLMEELEGSSVCVDYGIDRDVCCSIARTGEIYFPEDELPQTDAIIVTPYSAFGEIKTMLEEKVKCPIISLEEVVWSV